MAEQPIFDDSTEYIYNRLPEHFRKADAGQNYALKKYLTGTASTLNKVEQLIQRFDFTPIDDGGSPDDTSDLVDPKTADLEWLPWLAQLLGVSLSSTVVDEETRNEIINATNGYKAGTNDAIIAAVQSELVGSKSVKLTKRMTSTTSGGPWDLQISTLQSETLANILPQNIIVPTSARNLELHSVPEGSLDRISLTIEEDPNFYKSRAIEFRAVPANSGIGSENGSGAITGFGNDPFGNMRYGVANATAVGPSEYYFYSPFYFELDGTDPLSTFVDVSYIEGFNSTISVTAGIELFRLNGSTYTNLNTFVGTQNEIINVGDTHHVLGRSESIPATTTHGRWIIRLKNIGDDAIVHIGHFGARKQNVFQWVHRTADPVQAVIDRGAKPAGIKLWHVFSSSSWDTLENGGTTTWANLEAQPDWTSAEEYDG